MTLCHPFPLLVQYIARLHKKGYAWCVSYILLSPDPEDETFRVRLRQSSSLLFHGDCLLEIQRDFDRNLFHISIYTVTDEPPKLIVKWQIDHIRQYGSNDVAFKFQSGTYVLTIWALELPVIIPCNLCSIMCAYWNTNGMHITGWFMLTWVLVMVTIAWSCLYNYSVCLHLYLHINLSCYLKINDFSNNVYWK